MKMKIILTLCIIFLFFLKVQADVQNYAVQVSVEVEENPPRIIFSWLPDPAAVHYYVFKKAVTDSLWGDPIAVLSGSSIQFIDTDVNIGEAYEYGFYKNLHNILDTVYVANGTSLTFKIYDSWGDGIAPHHGLGYYKVIGYEAIYAEGGIFGHQELTSFIIDGGSGTTVDEIIVEIELDVFGAETTWSLEVNSSGEILASGGPYESPKFGHILAGIKYPFIENRGTVILLIDETFTNELENELDRLSMDLICDSWQVRRFEVNRNDGVPDIKQLIINECEINSSVKSIFIIGHVPVPYSGNVMSAHTNHCGAYPADLYYAELDDEWTDIYVSNTTASRPANHNVPGDGKFDQTFIGSGVDLEIGRVDMYDLPAFSQSEVELLKHYLDKDHNFRIGVLTAERRGLIDDNVGVLGGLAVAANGMRNFSAMFGASNIYYSDYLSTMSSESYLWSQGCGGGSYTSCAGVATTYDFAGQIVRTVFTMLYGSYFGDWDNTNNLLRAPLASDNSVLTCCWVGAPTWHFHHMVLGETIGYSTRISQNNISLYAPADKARQIHTALMGDPTLRMHVVKPVSNLQLELIDSSYINLTWTKSPDEIEGYHIYRSNSLYGSFSKITSNILLDTSFIDSDPLFGNNVYMVRAVKLELTGSGTYYNLSQGILDSIDITSVSIDERSEIGTFLKYELDQNYPNPFNPVTRIKFTVPQNPGNKRTNVRLTIFDSLGREIAVLVDEEKLPGIYEAEFSVLNSAHKSVNRYASGIFFYSIRIDDFVSTKKMLLIK